jgi:hypothetical protein
MSPDAVRQPRTESRKFSWEIASSPPSKEPEPVAHELTWDELITVDESTAHDTGVSGCHKGYIHFQKGCKDDQGCVIS